MWLRKSRKEPVLSHISMKNLPESERPYERFQILGAEALSDAELLAIILKTGAKDYTALDLARDLLSECQGNLLNLYEIGYEQLLERRGIGLDRERRTFMPRDRKKIGFKRIGFAMDHGSLDRVLELPDIPGPRVVHQIPHGFIRNILHFFPVLKDRFF